MQIFNQDHDPSSQKPGPGPGISGMGQEPNRIQKNPGFREGRRAGVPMGVLIFFGALAGIVLAGWSISKITGSRAHYIEDWKYDADETILWQDPQADTYVIPERGRAMITSYARPRRGTVIVTNKRILCATKPLFGAKKMLMYVLVPRGTPAETASTIHGGLLTVGYQTFLYIPGSAAAALSEPHPYVSLAPAPEAASSTNVQSIRIFTDQASSFRAPGE